MVAAQARDRRDAVEERHVKVDDDCLRIDRLDELDRLEAVCGRAGDDEAGLPVHEQRQSFDEGRIVVRYDDAEPVGGRRHASPAHLPKASLGPVMTQAPDPVAVIGAPLDLGAGRRGVDMGPSAIRYAGLSDRLERLGRTVVDRGNVLAAVPEATAVEDERARFLPEIKATCERVAGLVDDALDDGQLPLVLGGDHSVALGSIGAMAKAHGPGGALWVDAHGDVNTPGSSPSGNVHGMVLAALLGLTDGEFASEAWPLPALDPERVVLVGVRVLDDGEKELLRERGVCVFTMSDVDRLGVEATFSQALERAAGPGFVHVSFDMDAVDPTVAPGVGTPVQGGLSYREAHLAMELIAESGLLSSLDVVEVNPILDRENATAALAVDLVASALGARIL
jgi:arginase